MLVVIMAAAILVAGAPQVEPTAATPVAAQAELKPGERRVKMKCKSEAINGSRVVKRRCMTLEEWQRMEEESSKMLQEMQSRSPVIPTCLQSAMRSC